MVMPGRQIIGGEPYRYGYQGEFAETDEETGKPAFQLRIYDPRINRWMSPDPMGQYHSPYMAMDNRWNMSVDPTGGCTDCAQCPDACSGLGITSIESGHSIDYDFDIDKYFDRSDLNSTMFNQVNVSANSDMNLIYGNTWTIGAPQFKENGIKYQFTKDDLKTAISVLKSEGNDVISNQIRETLKDGLNGNPSPISKRSYYLFYGHTDGNMILTKSYFDMMQSVSFQVAKSVSPSANFKGNTMVTPLQNFRLIQVRGSSYVNKNGTTVHIRPHARVLKPK
jgi:RHS repeat-associated protein